VTLRPRDNKARQAVNAGVKITPREIAAGDDTSRDKKQWRFWEKLKARFKDDEFTHPLIDRLITSFLVNIMVACVWLTFGYIAWKLFIR
jgi:hypothetical protein